MVGRSSAIACLLGLVSAAGIYGADPKVTVPPDLVIEQFQVAKGGDPLVIPVKIAGKDHAFLVEQAAGCTCFDVRLVFDRPCKRIGHVATPDEDAFEVLMYDAPEASIGSLPVHVSGLVPGIDLEWLREGMDFPIEGVLGMDFLCRYVIHIDFDNGTLAFLKSRPPNVGTGVPIASGINRCPAVLGSVEGKGKVWFDVDTGDCRYGSGDLHASALSTQRSRVRYCGPSGLASWEEWDRKMYSRI